jgi:hypothetical protein
VDRVNMPGVFGREAGRARSEVAIGTGKAMAKEKRKSISADGRSGGTKRNKDWGSVPCLCCLGRGPCRLPALLIISTLLTIMAARSRCICN